MAHGNVIYVTDKCQKQSRIITQMWSQITLLHQTSYRNAKTRSYTGGLLLLYQPMHQSSHCVTLFLIMLRIFTPDTVNAESPQLNSQLTSFEPATTAEMRKIIMSSPSESSDVEPHPTILLKACLDVLIKPITDIINASLHSGLFPEDFKCAQVNPFLKKTTLPKEELNSYSLFPTLASFQKFLKRL